jgi:glutaredoxin 2
MPRRKKVDDLPDFEKDSVTQAVINTNSTAFINRREQMAKLADKDARIDRLENDIAELKKLVKGLTK